MADRLQQVPVNVLDRQNKKQNEYIFHSLGCIIYFLLQQTHCPNRDPFYKHELTLIPGCVNNSVSSKVRDKSAYPLSNFKDYTVEIWEWISDFISHLIMDVIIRARIIVKTI